MTPQLALTGNFRYFRNWILEYDRNETIGQEFVSQLYTALKGEISYLKNIVVSFEVKV